MAARRAEHTGIAGRKSRRKPRRSQPASASHQRLPHGRQRIAAPPGRFEPQCQPRQIRMGLRAHHAGFGHTLRSRRGHRIAVDPGRNGCRWRTAPGFARRMARPRGACRFDRRRGVAHALARAVGGIAAVSAESAVGNFLGRRPSRSGSLAGHQRPGTRSARRRGSDARGSRSPRPTGPRSHLRRMAPRFDPHSRRSRHAGRKFPAPRAALADQCRLPQSHVRARRGA